MGFPSWEFEVGFDRGSRLQARLPFGYCWSRLADGIVIRRLSENFNTDSAFEDVVKKTWAQLRSDSDFQAFLDEVSRLISPKEEADEAKHSS